MLIRVDVHRCSHCAFFWRIARASSERSERSNSKCTLASGCCALSSSSVICANSSSSVGGAGGGSGAGGGGGGGGGATGAGGGGGGGAGVAGGSPRPQALTVNARASTVTHANGLNLDGITLSPGGTPDVTRKLGACDTLQIRSFACQRKE